MRIIFIPGRPLYHPSLFPPQSPSKLNEGSLLGAYMENHVFPYKGKTWLFIDDKPGQHIKKQRHHFADKSPSSQNYGFSSGEIRMWELDHKEGWESKNWCFGIAVLEKTPESPWTARRSNQSILKETNPEYSLEGVILNLQYFGHLMWRADSLEKTLMLGKIESKKRRGWQRMRWLDSVTNSMEMNLSKLRKIVKDREGWCAAVHGVVKSGTQLSEWTPATIYLPPPLDYKLPKHRVLIAARI